MPIDLYERKDMHPSISIFYSMVEENYYRLLSSLENLSSDELHYKGTKGTSNSIAQLLIHLSYVDLLWIYRINDEALPQALEKQYGPMVDKNGYLPSVSGQSLRNILDQYEWVFSQFIKTSKTLEEKDLKKVIYYEGEIATIRWGMWHMSDHNRYHQAQINLLRKSYQIWKDEKNKKE